MTLCLATATLNSNVDANSLEVIWNMSEVNVYYQVSLTHTIPSSSNANFNLFTLTDHTIVTEMVTARIIHLHHSYSR